MQEYTDQKPSTDTDTPLPDSRPSSNGHSVSLVDVEGAIDSAKEYILGEQHEDGHWRAELEGGSILESEYIFAKYVIGERPEDSPKLRKAAEGLRRQQLDDAGWGTFPGDSTNVSASVEAYFVLKLMGDDPEAPTCAGLAGPYASRAG